MVREFYIPGLPVVWKRAAPVLNNGHIKMVDKQKTEKMEYGLYLKQLYKGASITNAVRMDVTFFLALPVLRKKEWDNLRDKHHDHIPDLSNCIKFLEDALVDAGILYDDRLIAEIVAKKLYADIPRTCFTLTDL